MPEGSCLNGGLLFRYGSLPNIATDVAMLIIPLPTIWKLQVSRLTRIGLFLTFALSSMYVHHSDFKETTDKTTAA